MAESPDTGGTDGERTSWLYLDDKAARTHWRREVLRAYVLVWWKAAVCVAVVLALMFAPVPFPARHSVRYWVEASAMAVVFVTALVLAIHYTLPAGLRGVKHLKAEVDRSDALPESAAGIPERVRHEYGPATAMGARGLFDDRRFNQSVMLAGMLWADIRGRRYWLAAWNAHGEAVTLPVGGALPPATALTLAYLDERAVRRWRWRVMLPGLWRVWRVPLAGLLALLIAATVPPLLPQPPTGSNWFWWEVWIRGIVGGTGLLVLCIYGGLALLNGPEWRTKPVSSSEELGLKGTGDLPELLAVMFPDGVRLELDRYVGSKSHPGSRTYGRALLAEIQGRMYTLMVFDEKGNQVHLPPGGVIDLEAAGEAEAEN